MKIHTKLVLIICFSICILSGRAVYAQSSDEYVQCGGDDPSSAFVGIPSGAYDVYAKLNVKEVSEQATVHIQSVGQEGAMGACQKIGSTNLSSQSYSKLAVPVTFTEYTTILYLSSPSSTSMQSAAAPQVILVAAGTQPCNVAADCKVMYKGESMNLSPKKISLSSDSLRVGLLIPVTDADTVKTVIYSIDGKPVYESKQLEPFNTKYVSGGEHTLGRRVVLGSGASLSDNKVIERGTIADINYVFQSIFFGQSKLIKLVFILVAVLIAWSLITLLARALYKRKLWRQTHVASASGYSIDSTKTGAQKNFYD